MEKGFGEEASKTAKARIKEEKYGEDFRALHEAYQVKTGPGADAIKKFTHSLGIPYLGV